MQKVLIMFVIFLSFSFVGCATILSGTDRSINIMTSAGEKVIVSVQSGTGQINVQAPGILRTKASRSDIFIQVNDPCYESTQSIITHRVNYAIFANLIFGGTFGTSTDYGTDAMWDYDHNISIQAIKKPTCK
jgi:hypothetical protein